MPRKQKPSSGESQWQRRFRFLQSVNLDAIAAEVNARRLAELNDRLAGEPRLTEAERAEILAHRARPPDPQRRGGRGRRRQYTPRTMSLERWKIRGLLVQRDDAGWPLTRLPSDQRASPQRMRQVVIAMHRVIGNDRVFVVSVERIASETGLDLKKVRRGVADLEAGSLIAVERRERARRRGGQGPSQYLIVWSNFAELAAQQGLQATLFAQEGPTPATGVEASPREAPPQAGRPDELSGRETPRVAEEVGRPEEFSGRGASGSAPTHSGSAPTHSGSAQHRARARPPFPTTLSKESSSPPTPPQVADPAEGPAERRRVLETGGWGEVRRRLWDYGLDDARATAQIAASHGWTADQCLELIGTCERAVVDGAFAWGAGALWWQLRNGQAGSRITLQPSEAYRRAKRTQDLQRQPAPPPSEPAEIPPGVAEAAAEIAAMGAADLRCLAERLLNHLQQAYWRRNGRAITPLVAKWLAWALAAERTAEEARS